MFFRKKLSPAADLPGPVGLTAPAPKPHANCNFTRKILIVDDDPVILKALSMKLKSRGYDVVTASDGSQALSAMRDEKPDLLIVDICFPPDVGCGGGVPWDGILLTQWIRQFPGGHVPAIIMTGSNRAEYKARASAIGAAGFFNKPIDNDTLFALIEAALRGNGGDQPAGPTKLSLN